MFHTYSDLVAWWWTELVFACRHPHLQENILEFLAFPEVCGTVKIIDHFKYLTYKTLKPNYTCKFYFQRPYTENISRLDFMFEFQETSFFNEHIITGFKNVLNNAKIKNLKPFTSFNSKIPLSCICIFLFIFLFLKYKRPDDIFIWIINLLRHTYWV